MFVNSIVLNRYSTQLGEVQGTGYSLKSFLAACFQLPTSNREILEFSKEGLSSKGGQRQKVAQEYISASVSNQQSVIGHSKQSIR